MGGEDRALERYRALLEQLMREEGDNESAVARRVGMTQSYVNKVRSRTRGGAGRKAITAAIEHLELDPAFFYGDHGEVDYRPFVRAGGAGPAERYPELAEFLATEEGKRTTEEERAYLRRAAFRGASVGHYRVLLAAFQGREPEPADDPTEAARGRALAKGGRPLKSRRRNGG